MKNENLKESVPSENQGDGISNVIQCAYNVVSDWHDDLIWCPSQCYKHIEFKCRHFIIYLRWRHSDPWTAELIESPNDGKFNMHTKFPWIWMNVEFWKDTELDQLKLDVEKKVNGWLLEHIE